MAQKTYILKWYHGSDPKDGWFLRGIRPDGTFYGETRKFFPKSGGIIIDVNGKLSNADLVEFHKLVNGIRKTPFKPEKSWAGLLAEGPIDEPNHPILYHYLQDSQKRTEADASFEAIIEIFRPYIEKYYDKLP